MYVCMYVCTYVCIKCAVAWVEVYCVDLMLCGCDVEKVCVCVCNSLQDYYRSGRMLVRMAEAIGRLVLAGREMTRLAG